MANFEDAPPRVAVRRPAGATPALPGAVPRQPAESGDKPKIDRLILPVHSYRKYQPPKDLYNRS